MGIGVWNYLYMPIWLLLNDYCKDILVYIFSLTLDMDMRAPILSLIVRWTYLSQEHLPYLYYIIYNEEK